MNIGNEYFKMCKYVEMDDVLVNNYDDLKNCYERPSDTKIKIDNYWRNLIFNECDEVIRYGVKGYNCNFFTLNAIVKIDGVKYYLYITKTRNEIHRIKED